MALGTCRKGSRKGAKERCVGQSFLGSDSCVMKGEGCHWRAACGRRLHAWDDLAHAVDMWGQGQEEAIPADVLSINSTRLITKCREKHLTEDCLLKLSGMKNREKTHSSEV